MAVLPRNVIYSTLSLVAVVAFLGFVAVFVYRAFAPRGGCSTTGVSTSTSPDGDYVATIQRQTCDVEALFDLGQWTSYSVRVDAKAKGNQRGWYEVFPIEDDGVPEPPGAPAASWNDPSTLEIQIPSKMLRGAYQRQVGDFVLIRRYIPANAPHVGRRL